MWSFFRDIAYRLPAIVWHSFRIGEGELGIVFILLYVMKAAYGNALMAWITLHPAWFLVPVGLIFCHLLMQAVYDKHQEVVQSKDSAIERERARAEKAVMDAIEMGRNGEKAYKELDHNWHKKYVEVTASNETLANRVKDLEGRLEEREKKKIIASLLGMAVHSGAQLLNQQLSSEAEVPGWVAQVQAWYQNTNSQIHANMSPTDATMFSHVTTQGTIGFSHSIGEQHNSVLNQLNGLIENLRGLHQRYV